MKLGETSELTELKQALSDKFAELEYNHNFLLEATKTSTIQLEEKMNTTLKYFEGSINEIKQDIDNNLKGSIANAVDKVERFEMNPIKNAATLSLDFGKDEGNYLNFYVLSLY